MKYITDRKRATGLGSARGGTQHFWRHLVSSILLQVLIPAFIVVFAIGFGGSREEVIAYYSHPIPAIVTLLTLVVVMLHLMREVHEAIEDYIHGLFEKLMIVATQAYTYVLITIGIYTLFRLAI